MSHSIYKHTMHRSIHPIQQVHRSDRSTQHHQVCRAYSAYIPNWYISKCDKKRIPSVAFYALNMLFLAFNFLHCAEASLSSSIAGWCIITALVCGIGYLISHQRTTKQRAATHSIRPDIKWHRQSANDKIKRQHIFHKMSKWFCDLLLCP